MQKMPGFNSNDCSICNAPGTVVFDGLKDILCGTEDLFSVKKCSNCGLLWLVSPVPLKDILQHHQKYHDAEDGKTQARRSMPGLKDAVRRIILCGRYGYRDTHKKHFFCGLGSLLAAFPALRSGAIHGLGPIFPPHNPDPEALLIDIGCGSGNYLQIMRELGWKVLGIEPDAAGANIAASKGIPVFNGVLEAAKLPDCSASHITMVHVLEHLPDPESVIKECRRILKPGGGLAIRTPNADGLTFKIFGRSCYILDIPRHLFLFTPKSARLLFEKIHFKKFYLRTSARAAAHVYSADRIIAKNKKIDKNNITHQKGSAWFALKERIGCYLGKECGEEIEIFAVK